MESVVHQSPGDVLLVDARVLEPAQIQNHLVGDPSVRPRVQHRIVRLQAGLQIVRAEDGLAAGGRQPFGAQHADVAIRNEQHAGAAPWRRRDCRNGMLTTHRHHGVAGQVRREMRGHGNRSHAGSSPAMRDGKRLVQVEMTDIGADLSRAREPNLRVHVGAVHVHLPAVLVHDVADFLDAILEHAVRGGIRNHQGGKPLAVLFALALRSSTSTLPCSSVRTTTTRMPAATAVAGLVPWADAGISTTSRCA